MSKAVLTTKINPSYDDLPEQRYHFPRRYLNAVKAALNDWIVYYEPRRGGGRQSYFATARIVRIDEDPHKDDHYYAYVKDYLEFDRPVPFRGTDGFFYESGLRKDDGSVNKGSFGRSVRSLPDVEYNAILAKGFANELGTPQQIRGTVGPEIRHIVEGISKRPFRDQKFATGIKRIYDNTCAMSGLRIINGGGRAEAQAAHIRPVKDNGPDSLRNGIALSSTFHWMFDRGLISIDDDYTLLFKKNAIPDHALSWVNPDRRLRKPKEEIYLPHREFLQYHREHVFKG